jgi:hypothetical protein
MEASERVVDLGDSENRASNVRSASLGIGGGLFVKAECCPQRAASVLECGDESSTFVERPTWVSEF